MIADVLGEFVWGSEVLVGSLWNIITIPFGIGVGLADLGYYPSSAFSSVLGSSWDVASSLMGSSAE
ncbi:hypothetical protein [Corynebacterium lubricantis]|uniref:hypothetical protein n=1 Tax=Corynebacterium lubricantis TaxID=541095 RepID=UPI0003634589|nr:hypothetical protein [Corynebacterium lubricantis]